MLKATDDTERYRIQWRHKWEADKDSYWLAEYHKIRDTKFIKDYFLREYEKNAQPATYILYNRVLPDFSNFSILNQKRTNRIFTETEKLPEIKHDKANTQIFETPLYVAIIPLMSVSIKSFPLSLPLPGMIQPKVG